MSGRSILSEKFHDMHRKMKDEVFDDYNRFIRKIIGDRKRSKAVPVLICLKRKGVSKLVCSEIAKRVCQNCTKL